MCVQNKFVLQNRLFVLAVKQELSLADDEPNETKTKSN